MKIAGRFFLLFMGLFWFPKLSFAQETDSPLNIEESAEVFLEAYSDEFQEKFFEGLKQKGIENYDRAINLFLECEKIEANNTVIWYELAKSYTLNKQYILSQEYAIKTVNSAPENYWYLYTLVQVLQKQSSDFSIVKSEIPFSNNTLQLNLARIYFNQKNFGAALRAIENVKKTSFSETLTSKIKDSIKKQKAKTVTTSASFSFKQGTSNEASSVQNYKMRIQGQMRIKGNALVLQTAKKALEEYPTQPYFYYAQGYALNRTKKYRDAVEILEAGLDYLLDDISLANKIYKELSDSYKGVNNISKSNMYLRKIKPGF